MTLFSQQTFSFLMENRLRNDKAWFQEHHSEYEQNVLAPFRSLITRLIPTMLEIDPQIQTGPKPDRLLSRIYRDTRFSRDKSFFKERMWLIFSREKRAYDGPPAFYFQISPDGFVHGCGYYQASSADMDAMRELILERHPAFLQAKAMMDQQERFSLAGELYKRSHWPDLPEDVQNWLNRKTIAIRCPSTDFDLLYSDELADWLSEGFQQLKPVYAFFLTAAARKLHR